MEICKSISEINDADNGCVSVTHRCVSMIPIPTFGSHDKSHICYIFHAGKRVLNLCQKMDVIKLKIFNSFHC